MRDLEHVCWLGGGSGAGKSTVARRLAALQGLRLYSTDEAMADHGRRSCAETAPLLSHFSRMSMDQRWLDRPPRVMLDTSAAAPHTTPSARGRLSAVA